MNMRAGVFLVSLKLWPFIVNSSHSENTVKASIHGLTYLRTTVCMRVCVGSTFALFTHAHNVMDHCQTEFILCFEHDDVREKTRSGLKAMFRRWINRFE